ncbi:MAG: DUF1638 domain-containing protein [Candidatus Bathyarchaeia archaeon]|jgi:hypothetical protein
MTEKAKICLVSCSVLREEIQQLIKQGSLDADVVFVSKYFHVDYEMLEKNLRKVIETTQKRFHGKVVLVYGDLCLGQDNEMKKLAEEYNVVKVDALNCIDCQLGGKGKSLEVDSEHNLMFMGSGMVEFFKHMKERMLKEGVDEAGFANLFSGIKGAVLLDTCGDSEKWKEELEKSGIGLRVLETRKIGLENVNHVLLEAIEKATSS